MKHGQIDAAPGFLGAVAAAGDRPGEQAHTAGRYTCHVAYEEVEHTADWALRVRGADLVELLESAVAGALDLAGVELSDRPSERRQIELESHDPESLVVDFLTELVIALELRQAAFQDLQLETDGERRLWGTVREVPAEHIGKHIKAVTYSELEIEEDQDGITATIVFDV